MSRATAEAALPSWQAEAALALASGAAVVGLGRLFADASFLPPVLLAAAASHGLASAARRRGVAPLAAGLLSGVALAVFVAWVVESRLGFFLPSTWHAVRADLATAWHRFGEVVAPTKATRGFVLASVGGAWIGAFVADTFAFRAHARLEAMVPSFTLFLFGSFLGADRHRVAFAALYLAAVLGFFVMAHAWGDGESRPWFAGQRQAGEVALMRTGLGVALAAVALGALLGPHLPGAGSRGLIGWRDRGSHQSGTRVTVSPLVDIRGRLVAQSDVELFTVRADDPSYWRLTSLDRFDGSIWSSLGSYRPAASRLPEPAPTANRGGSASLRQEFSIGALSSIWLPAAYRPDKLSPSARVRFDVDSASLATDKATSDGLRYTVESALPRLTAEELAPVQSAGTPPDVLERYLPLPPDFPASVRRTAQQVAGPGNSPYRQAKALQDWFRNTFTYSLDVPAGHDERAIVNFLNGRKGYCEQFAGTYAAMARAVGLPARVAVGFTAGTKGADGLWHVTGKEAHAWPEVYLSGYGWVAFEPTPGRGLPGAEDYTDVRPAQAADTPATTVPSTGTSDETVPDTTPADEPAVAPVSVPQAGSHRLVVAGGLMAAVALYAVALPAVNRRRRRRRRDAAATPAEQVLVAWTEAQEDLASAGLPRRPHETAVEYSTRVARAAGGAGPPLVRLASDTQVAAWSGAGVPPDTASRARATAEAIRADLRAQATLRERVQRALDPRTVLTTGDDKPERVRTGSATR